MAMSAIDLPVGTVAELLALPDDGLRHELLAGEHVVTPSPRLAHQHVHWMLSHRLAGLVESRSDLRGYSGPADVFLGTNTLVQPDISIFRVDPSHPPQQWDQLDAPELAVEILSPDTASRDRGKKREIYQKAGVAEYWIVDIDSQLVERWRPGDERPEIIRDTLEWRPDEDGDVLEIDLASLWP